jgi:SagB-type dehydrogenase family enzyme
MPYTQVEKLRYNNMGDNIYDDLPWKYYHKYSLWDQDSRLISKTLFFDLPQLFFEKRYPRFERLKLSPPNPVAHAVEPRQSTRSFKSKFKIKQPELYGLLEPLFPIKYNGESHLMYSSAGALYAVETYIYSSNVEGLEDACFYHVLKSECALEKLWVKPKFLQSTFQAQTWVHDCALLIIFTLNMTPYHSKYGDRGYRFGLIEVGSILQLLTTSEVGSTLPSCVLGGFDDHEVLSALDLSKECDEQPVCCIAFGGIT